MPAPRRSYRNEPIAIIGSGCRFPGESNTPSRLWDLLKEPRDVQSEIPEDRFNRNGFFNPIHDHHGTSDVLHSYFLSEDPRQFDASFFGIKPVEAISIDPQQRMLLEIVYESLEDAGLSVDALRGSSTAIYVGMMCAEYAGMLERDPGDFPTYFASGTARSLISNRVSYFFDWHGPSMTIDTACSSSLVAVHQAIQELRHGEARVAIAAGANLLFGPEAYIAMSSLKMLSPTGRSRMWSENADGYARGEGIAAVVLKPLSAALEDGDNIESLIVESGINQDGKTKGITQPSATAQAALIEATYKKAGLDLKKASDRPQYFEAHGTGTPTGDPLEAEAISTAFFKRNPPTRVTDPLFVGSIKSVIGHTEGTAGVAGLLKTSLALKHSVIPPNLLFDTLAPAVKPFYTNLEIATRARPWPTTERNTPRRASLNSFGFGGANAHCILEEHVSVVPISDDGLPVYTPFVLSAVSEKALTAVAASYADFLRARPPVDLRALSYTLSDRRNAFNARISFSARDMSDLLSKLDAFVEGRGEAHITPVSASNQPACVLGIFTGQGAQWATMASKLMHSPAIEHIVDDLDRSLSELTDYPPQWSLKSELLAHAAVSRVKEAAISQPACTAVQIVLVDLLRAAGITFSAVVGHSSGEIGAAYAAGYLSASDAIRISYYRGVHLQLAQSKTGKQGAMLAAGTSYEDAQSLCNYRKYRGKLCVAASNSATSVTISGDADSIDSVKTVLEDEKKFARLLKVDKAYHSHHMHPCSEPYMRSLRGCGVKARKPTSPSCLWVSSVYQRDINEVQDSLNDSYWNSNLVSPVLFSQALGYALGEAKFDFAVELGPHPALKGPASQVIQEALGETIPYTGLLSRDVDDVVAVANGLGYIWASMSGSVVDFKSYDKLLNEAPTPRILKGLPTYPWQHDRAYWHESRTSKVYRERSKRHELLGVRCPNHSENQVSWTNYLIPRELPWILGHRIQGQMVFPAAGYMSTAFEAARDLLAADENMQLLKLKNFAIGPPLVFDAEDSAVEILFSLSEIRREGNKLLSKFSYYSTASKDARPLKLNADGQLEITIGEPDASMLRPMPEHQFGMIEVDHQRFYGALDMYGFNYTGPFKCMDAMERKLGIATASIGVPDTTTTYGSDLLIHPAPLDAAIQAILLAYCYPGDGRLVSIQLPTDVLSITVNPAQAFNAASKDSLTCFSTIVRDDGGRIEGDSYLFPSNESNALIQLEGLCTRPLVPASEITDVHLFSEALWELASPDPMLVSATASADFQFGFVLERVAHYYLRNLKEGTSMVDRENCEWYHEYLFEFSDNMLSRVTNDTHPYAKKEWANDTYRDIITIIESHPESIDLRIMRAVGENIISVVRGETAMLEPMMEKNMLIDFYVNGFGMQEYLAELTTAAKQIGHRYPAMNILEIGAGTGGATKSILRELDEAFASYTYTDISSGFFESAKDVFKERESRMIFKTLDIERNVIDQGFAESSYDLIIASLVLHATSKLDETMKNVRRLLRPGGYLLLLEITDNEQMRFGFIFGGLPGWWLGHEDGRRLSPCIDAPSWDKLLKKHGFSGVDSIAPHRTLEPLPLCVMLGQAVDERIEFLRSPLSATVGESLDIAQLTIIGGATSKTADFVSTISGLLLKFTQVTQVASLTTVSAADLPFGGTVVCVQDHDMPVFEDFDPSKLIGLQKLFGNSKNVFWVTRGYKQRSPYSKMMVAFARCLVQEMQHLRIQFLDIPSTDPLDARLVLECLLRFLVADKWDGQGRLKGILWSVEPEISYELGKDYIPRLKLNKVLNNRYNAAHRRITETVNLRDVLVTLSLENDVFTIKAKDGLIRRSYISPAHATESVQICVSRSLLKAVKVGSLGYFYLALGTIANSGAEVLALAQTLSNVIDVPRSLVRSYVPGAEDEADDHLVATFYALISHTAMRDLESGDVLVVLEPNASLATALSTAAEVKGIQVQIFSSSALSEENRIKHLKGSSHPLARQRDALAATRKQNVSQVLCCRKNEWSSGICNALSSAITVETYDLYTAFSASLHVSSSKQRRVSTILDQARTEAFSDAVSSTIKKMSSTSHHRISITAMQDMTPKWGIDDVVIVDWKTSSTVPITLESVDARPLFRNDRSYWLVGLTGGLGLSLCRWMISHGAKYIAISSRKPSIDPRWFEVFESEGATVKVYANDVTDRDAVQKTWTTIQADLPPVAGVCHGAMVLQDTLFQDLDIPRMEKVLKPKVNGAKYLDEIFQHQPLDFFVMLSSMAAVTGNAGQSAYAAANMFIAGLAAQRRHRGVAASTVNIGAVMGNGYVTRELTLAQQVALQKIGNIWLSEQAFFQIFAEGVVASSQPGPSREICTGLRLFYADEDEKPQFARDPVFSHLMRHRNFSGSLVGGNATAIPMKAQLLEATTAGDVYEIMKDALSVKLQAVLQTDPDTSVVDLTADALGVDSLVAVDLRSWFLKELSVDMPVLKIVSGATIGEILERAQELLDPALVPALGAEASEEKKKATDHSNESAGKLALRAGARMIDATSPSGTDISAQGMSSKPGSAPLRNTEGTSPQPATQDKAKVHLHTTLGLVQVEGQDLVAHKGSVIANGLPTTQAQTQLIAPLSPIKHNDDPRARLFSESSLSTGSLTHPSTIQNSHQDTSMASLQASSTPPPASEGFCASPSTSSISSFENIHPASVKDGVIHRIAPMSFGQARFWFLRSYLDDPTTFNITTSIHLHGKLRVDDLAQAVATVGQRHEALRTRFFTDDNNQPSQAVMESSYLRLERKSASSDRQVREEYDRLRNHVYDLENGEAVRIVLLELSSVSHQIILGSHHINWDGVSFEIFFSDLEQAYNSSSAALQPVLQYPDFAIKQKHDFESGKWQSEIAYWKKEFGELPPPLPLLSLSNRAARTPLTKYDSHMASHRVSSKLSAKVNETCKKMKVSVFQFYLTVYKILMTRFADVEDLCIGVADANRNDPDQQNSLGCYLNLLPIRFDTRAATFSEAVRQVRSKAQQAYAHSNVPFDVILSELRVPRSSHHSPLFQIFLNYRQGVAEKRTFAGCSSEWTDNDSGRIAYDLSLDIVDNAGGDALFRLHSQTELYTVIDTEVIMNSFVSFVEAFANNPAARVTRPPLYADDNTQSALETGSGPIFDLRWQGTIVDRIDQIVREHGQLPAIKSGRGHGLSYHDMNKRVHQISNALKHISPNAYVGVFQEPSADWICSLLAIMRIGCVYVPLDPRSLTMRLASMVKDCQPIVILIDDATETSVSKLQSAAEIINITKLASESAAREVPNVSKAEATFALLYTSGSTGTPKGILLKHAAIRSHTETVVSKWISSVNSPTALQQSSLNFDMSLNQIFWPLCLAGQVVIVPQSARGDPVEIVRIMAEEKINITAATPSEYASWIEYGDKKALRTSLWNLAISGGESFPQTLIQAFDELDCQNLRVMNCYGPTEITCFSHYREIQFRHEYHGRDMELKPWYNVCSYVVDSKYNRLPVGLPGEVVLGGMGVASGYFNQSELSEIRFKRNPYASGEYLNRRWDTVHLSGDRGRITSEGNLLLEGRVTGDTQIKLRGLRIDLQEIETTMVQQSQGNILHAVVSVRQLGGTASDVLVAHVEFSSRKDHGDVSAYCATLQESLPLPQYMRPSLIVPIDKLPRNDSGKLDRLAIQSFPLTRETQAKPSSKPQDSTESRLLQLWENVLTKELLGCFTVDSETDFFSVGGTSILLVALRARIQEAFGLDIPLVQLFDASALGTMATKIHNFLNLNPVAKATAPAASTAMVYEQASMDNAVPGQTVKPGSIPTEIIDWELETNIPPSLVPATVLGSKEPRVVLLTGSTGFLGKAVLQRLIAVPSVKKIYCVAIRSDYAHIHPMFSSDKVFAVKGNLSLPLLGIPTAELPPMLTEVDAILHMGGDVSFLKSYQSLRLVNFECTKQLAKWAVEYGIQFHYISTAGVANLTRKESYQAVSVRQFPPPTDGSSGYIASKWASEVYLERLSGQYLMPLVIHRPSGITGPGVPETDIMGSVVRYSHRMRAVPRSPYIKGWIDLISVDSVADDVVRAVTQGHQELEVQYVYESGGLEVRIEDLKSSMEEQIPGETVQELTIEEWVRRAVAVGMNSMVAAYLMGIRSRPLQMAKLVKDLSDENVESSPNSSWKAIEL